VREFHLRDALPGGSDWTVASTNLPARQGISSLRHAQRPKLIGGSRLNRGGDRRLNKALHMAVIVRMTHDAGTKAYVERRVAEGLTKREIRRVLKRRYLRCP
jgi:hypothetical protein